MNGLRMFLCRTVMMKRPTLAEREELIVEPGGVFRCRINSVVGLAVGQAEIHIALLPAFFKRFLGVNGMVASLRMLTKKNGAADGGT